MKSNYTANQRFNGVETQLADCAVCMIHTYIAHDDFQNDFLRYPDKRDDVLAPYIEAYLDGQDREQRAIGNRCAAYNIRSQRLERRNGGLFSDRRNR